MLFMKLRSYLFISFIHVSKISKYFVEELQILYINSSQKTTFPDPDFEYCYQLLMLFIPSLKQYYLANIFFPGNDQFCQFFLVARCSLLPYFFSFHFNFKDLSITFLPSRKCNSRVQDRNIGRSQNMITQEELPLPSRHLLVICVSSGELRRGNFGGGIAAHGGRSLLQLCMSV